MLFHFIFVTNFIRNKNPLYGTQSGNSDNIVYDFTIITQS